MFGVINIYKPKGITSHDVVGIVRKILGIKQVGHTGTLDPFAEGVLPICVGKATRLIEYFDDDKEYIASVQFGSSTETYDTEGQITDRSDKKITQTDILENLRFFRGEIEQTPPIYSAIKVNGKKLYEYAREGKPVEIEPRKVTIYEIELLGFDNARQIADIRIKCSKGTYIRSIANDLGEKLGCYGHLIRLVRSKAGKFNVENSVKLPVLISSDKKYTIENGAKEKLLPFIQNPTEAVSIPVTEISDADFERVSHGNSIKISDKKFKCGDFLILVYNNNVVATAQQQENEIRVKKVFVE